MSLENVGNVAAFTYVPSTLNTAYAAETQNYNEVSVFDMPQNQFEGIIPDNLFNVMNGEAVVEQSSNEVTDIESLIPKNKFDDVIPQSLLDALRYGTGNYETSNSGKTTETSTAQASETEKYGKGDMHKDITKITKSTSHLGTNEKELSQILAKYAGSGQIDELAQEFKTLHNKDLKKELLDEMKSDKNAQKYIKTLFGERKPGRTYDMNNETEVAQAAQQLHNALHRAGTDEDALIDILGNPNYTAEDIAKIEEKYNDMFAEADGKDLKHAVNADTQGATEGFFNKLLMERLNG